MTTPNESMSHTTPQELEAIAFEAKRKALSAAVADVLRQILALLLRDHTPAAALDIAAAALAHTLEKQRADISRALGAIDDAVVTHAVAAELTQYREAGGLTQ